MGHSSFFSIRGGILFSGFAITCIWVLLTDWISLESSPRIEVIRLYMDGPDLLRASSDFPLTPALLSWIWPVLLGTLVYIALPTATHPTSIEDPGSNMERITALILPACFGIFMGLLGFLSNTGRLHKLHYTASQATILTLWDMLSMGFMIGGGLGILIFILILTSKLDDDMLDTMRIGGAGGIGSASLIIGFHGIQSGVGIFLTAGASYVVTFGTIWTAWKLLRLLASSWQILE